ncbi:LysR family transcriptional regulator [Morganella psychrotolerans]|uniref:LysR family transcriptional regulator n=1 Tax=Morganella psychrotolerans TaxID=368603 RepID=UPI0039AFC8E3
MKINHNVFKISNLVAFHSIVNHGSFSMAAKFTHRSQGQLSQIVSAIEEASGTGLFIRTSSGVQLNEQGHIFAQESRKYLESYNIFLKNISNLSEPDNKSIVIYAPPGFIHYLSSHIIQPLSVKFPYISVTMKKCHPGDINNYDHLLREADIILSFVPSIHPMTVNTELELEMGFYTGIHYAENTKLSHPLHLLKEQCIVVDSYGSEHNVWRYYDDGKINKLDIQPKFQCHDIISAIIMATNNVGIVYVPKIVAEEYVNAGKLRPLLSSFNLKVPYYIIYKKEKNINKNTTPVRSFIIKHVKSMS